MKTFDFRRATIVALVVALGAGTTACAYDDYGRHDGRGRDGRDHHRGDRDHDRDHRGDHNRH